MQKLFLVGMGGFFGAISRYLIDGFFITKTRSHFPLGTFAINVTGSFLLGLVFVLTLEKFTLSDNYRFFFGIGFIGAYTTFSTYMLESYKLMETSGFFLAVFNVIGSIFFGFLAIYLGIIIGRVL